MKDDGLTSFLRKIRLAHILTPAPVLTQMSSNPLISAIASGEVNKAISLIEEGAFINDYDEGPEIVSDGKFEPRRTGRTPLIVASEIGQYDCVRSLLEKKVKVDLKEKTKAPPLKRTALSYAAEKGHTQIVEALLSFGANPNSRDDNFRDEIRGKTSLHYAAENGHLAVVDLLLAHDAVLNERTKCGYTPLILAMDGERFDVVAYLLEKGADVSASTNQGWTILLSAIASSSADINFISKVLENGANPDGQAGLHGTPLMQAIMRRRLDVVIELIKRGADVNKAKANGFTPLMYAALNQAWDACEVLISNNADLEARNRTGDSVFTITEREGTAKKFGLVLEKAAKSRR